MQKAVMHAEVQVGANVERLRAFLRAYRSVQEGGDVEGRLNRFVARAEPLLRETKPHLTEPSRPTSFHQLSSVIEKLRGPLAGARVAGAYVNVWKVASLGRNEVRNAAVLAWLLAPQETHGCGDMVMRALFRRAILKLPGWDLGEIDLMQANVRTELRPQGSDRDRVDIAIAGPDYVIFAEIKIDAAEGAGQLQRYAQAAEAMGKPKWRLIYLSPVDPVSKVDGMVHLTWNDVEACLRTVVRQTRSDIVKLILTQYAEHVHHFV